ncbi:hypothetical protein A2W14_01070 [Candidatus Gottesmanbacteria bacterium RBG_16_37_8]|uniref:Baseplate protein J-like domain-containing protein n=1 Tax=Candidatus Gottesmanbacteria bacterium RBG_16_37_8 TaxID=1798371 RepID=A0A1F5YQF7_9BACT|nr:MAG: hypothetical protein A2W14_01070 [Candidatus Gottesmanbacteria bacterium RBG_16_37_8]
MSILSELLPKKEITNYFIVLGLEEHQVRAAVAEIVGEKVRILGTGKSEFGEEENETEAVDIAISMAEKTIPEKLLINNVIFALPQFYLEGNDVKPEYSKRLKSIAKELDLKVYGFVDYVTSIINYLETTEGSPPTVILMDLSSGHMTISLVRIGKVSQHVIVDRTDSIVADFSSTLPQLKTEILPSKIIIYDFADKTEEIREELLKFPWHKHSIFLHTPKIDIFTNEKIMKSIVEAAATSFLPNFAAATEKADREEKLQEEESGETAATAYSEEIVVEETSPEIKRETGKRFGFINESLSEKAAAIKKETKPLSVKGTGGKPGLSSVMSFLSEKLDSVKAMDFSKKLATILQHKALTLLVPIILVVLFFTYLLLNFPSATVSLITYPQPQSTPMEIIFAKDNSQAAGSVPVILIRSVTSEISGNKSAKSTGTTLLGDKAKGEVTVFNKTTSAKTLPKGSVLSSGPVKFTLDDEVKIASASETGEGITFGKISAKITASTIGPDSNLSANSNFTFQSFSESTLTAKNNLPLSGGTSREISSVSGEDRGKLEEATTSELVTQVKQKLVGQINPRERLLDQPVTTTVSAKKFSAEVGSEAKDLSLDLTLKVEGFAYNQDNLEALINPSTLSAVSGFKFDPTKTTVRIVDTDIDKSGNIKAKVSIIAYFVPDLNLETIRNDIRGKSYTQAISILEKVDKIGGVKISPVNKLPFWQNKLPLNPKNISMAIISR